MRPRNRICMDRDPRALITHLHLTWVAIASILTNTQASGKIVLTSVEVPLVEKEVTNRDYELGDRRGCIWLVGLDAKVTLIVCTVNEKNFDPNKPYDDFSMKCAKRNF